MARDCAPEAAIISHSGCLPNAHGAKCRDAISDFPCRTGIASSSRGSLPSSTSLTKRSRRRQMSSWTQPASYFGRNRLIKGNKRRPASTRAAFSRSDGSAGLISGSGDTKTSPAEASGGALSTSGVAGGATGSTGRLFMRKEGVFTAFGAGGGSSASAGGVFSSISHALHTFASREGNEVGSFFVLQTPQKYLMTASPRRPPRCRWRWRTSPHH